MNAAPTSSPYLDGAVLDAAVALVTSAHDGHKNVMTASFFAESSHVPALVRVSIATTAWSHELITCSGWFGLSLLSRDQSQWALGCGTGSGRDGCRFERWRLRWRPGPHGLPLLDDCLTTTACRVVERVDLPGHTLFVGAVAQSYRQTAVAYRPTLLLSDLVNDLHLGARDAHARSER
jgi:flavin reductase (DIM6/NTAB) family NADH-FMN oxidoreductase RutF